MTAIAIDELDPKTARRYGRHVRRQNRRAARYTEPSKERVVHITASDYKALADAVYGLGTIEPEHAEIETKNPTDSLVVTVARHPIGDCVCEAILSNLNGHFELLTADCYDRDEMPVPSDFKPRRLLSILN